jgi:hypothetical protein
MAQAEADLDYQVFDIQAGYWFPPNEIASVRVFAGPRGANIEQSLDLVYSGGNVATRVDSTEAVPVLDVAVGINLTAGKLSLQTGYELSNWFNVDQRLNFTGAATIMRGSLTPSVQDLLVDGLFVRLAYNY